MALSFRDCPYCGRGIVLSLLQFHLTEAHSHEIAISKAKPYTKPKKTTSAPSKKQKAAKPAKAAEPKPSSDPRVRRAIFEQKLRAQARTQVNVQVTALIRRGKETGKPLVGEPKLGDEVRLTVRRLPASAKEKKTADDGSTASRKVKGKASKSKPRFKPTTSRPSKFITVSSPCSCQGLNENCFKCWGSGQEQKQVATSPGSDTTLFGRASKNSPKLGSFASDSRGNEFALREKGQFDSRPICDSYGDEDVA